MPTPGSFLRDTVRLALNRYFWAGFAVLAAVLLLTYLAVDRILMPSVTRHDMSTTVPDVMSLKVEDAESIMERVGLVPEFQLLRKPNLPRDVVIDQRPPAGAEVKPGRRIYLTINTGDTSTVAIPKVLGLSIREAQSRMVLLGLVVPEMLPDSIPSSHANTVTRQEPTAGMRVPLGSSVSLWYSTGLGEASVTVPNVVGLSPDVARERLLALRLRSVILGEENDLTEPTVLDQSPAEGTLVREGFEVRLRLAASATEVEP